MKLMIAVALAGMAAAGTAQADPKAVYGKWLTAGGSAHIAIEDCGNSTPCGTLVWMDPDTLSEGITPETATDQNNPDPDRHADPLLGLLMLSDFSERKDDWRGGKIYDPETGRTYGSRLKRLEDGTLQVKGCIGPICQTQIWTEVAGTPANASDETVG